MATKAVVGRGLREAGAALKHASGLEVCASSFFCHLSIQGHHFHVRVGFEHVMCPMPISRCYYILLILIFAL
jgi:hypothetical protein